MKGKEFFLLLITRYFRFISLFFLITGLLCAYSADFNFKVEHSIDTWVEKTSEPWKLYQNLRSQFGDDETLLVAFELKHLTTKRLPQFRKLIKDLQNNPGVKKVFDPIELFLLNPKKHKLDRQSIRTIRESLLHSPPDYRNVLLSRNLETVGIMILCHQNQQAHYPEILSQIRQGLNDIGIPFKTAGTIYFSDTLVDTMSDDLSTVMTELILIALFGIAIFLWSWKLSLCVLAGIVLSLLYTLAFATWLDIKLNLLSLVFFPLVFCMNLTNVIHLFSRRDHQGFWRLRQAYPDVLTPAFITMLATTLGSTLFLLARQSLISDVGIMLPFSIVISFLCSMFFVPSAYRCLAGNWNLSFLRPPPQITHKQSYTSAIISLLLVVAAITALSVLPKLKTNPDAFYFFNQDSELIHSYRWIEDHLTGMLVVDIIIQSTDKGNLSTPKHLDQLQTFTKILRRKTDLSTILSGVKWLEIGMPSAIIPGLEKALVSKNKQTTRLVLRYRSTGDLSYTEIENNLQQLWSDTDHNGLEMQITGLLPLILKSEDELLKTLSIIFPVVLLMMCLLLLILMRSFRVLFLAVIANFIPLLITAGAMVLFNISINSINLFVISIILGVTVDNTIHLLFAWQQKHSIDQALTTVLPALWTTSIIVGLAFVALLLSDLAPVMEFGWLSIIVVSSAYLCDRYLLPFLINLQRSISQMFGISS